MPDIVPTVDRDERSDQLIKDAAELARDTSDDSTLVGYVVMAMYSDGSGRTAGWKPNREQHQLGAQLWSAWAEHLLQHHFMYSEGVDATYAVLNGDA